VRVPFFDIAFIRIFLNLSTPRKRFTHTLNIIHLEYYESHNLKLCGNSQQWKKPKTKIKKLIQLGVPQHEAYEWGNSRMAYWRISNSPILHKALGNSYWNRQGLKSLYEKYCDKRHLFDCTAVYGTVRTVV